MVCFWLVAGQKKQNCTLLNAVGALRRGAAQLLITQKVEYDYFETLGKEKDTRKDYFGTLGKEKDTLPAQGRGKKRPIGTS